MTILPYYSNLPYYLDIIMRFLGLKAQKINIFLINSIMAFGWCMNGLYPHIYLFHERGPLPKKSFFSSLRESQSYFVIKLL
jgi:hypothetical protein